jgi:hypothetical protein
VDLLVLWIFTPHLREIFPRKSLCLLCIWLLLFCCNLLLVDILLNIHHKMRDWLVHLYPCGWGSLQPSPASMKPPHVLPKAIVRLQHATCLQASRQKELLVTFASKSTARTELMNQLQHLRHPVYLQCHSRKGNAQPLWRNCAPQLTRLWSNMWVSCGRHDFSIPSPNKVIDMSWRGLRHHWFDLILVPFQVSLYVFS